MGVTYKVDNIEANTIEENLNKLSKNGWSLKERRLIPGSSPAMYAVVLQKEDSRTSTTVEYNQATGELTVVYDPKEVEILDAHVDETGEVIVVENILK